MILTYDAATTRNMNALQAAPPPSPGSAPHRSRTKPAASSSSVVPSPMMGHGIEGEWAAPRWSPLLSSPINPAFWLSASHWPSLILYPSSLPPPPFPSHWGFPALQPLLYIEATMKVAFLCLSPFVAPAPVPLFPDLCMCNAVQCHRSHGLPFAGGSWGAMQHCPVHRGLAHCGPSGAAFRPQYCAGGSVRVHDAAEAAGAA